MDKNLEKLQIIKGNLDKLDKEYKEIRGDVCCVTDNPNQEIYYKCMDTCYQMVSSLRQYVYSIEDNFYKTMDNHNQGHLPKINGAEKMQNALETLGISEDYDLQKPVIYVRASRQGNKEFSVDLNMSKKV